MQRRLSPEIDRTGVAPSAFHDLAISFTARLVAGRVGAVADHPTSTRAGVQRNREAIVAALSARPMTAGELATKTGLSVRQVRYGIGHLEDDGVIVSSPVNGKTLLYSVAHSAVAEPSVERD